MTDVAAELYDGAYDQELLFTVVYEQIIKKMGQNTWSNICHASIHSVHFSSFKSITFPNYPVDREILSFVVVL